VKKRAVLMPADHMANETEIKLHVKDLRAFLAKLKALGAGQVSRDPAGGGANGRVHERNVLFDTPKDGLRKRGALLRIRTETRTKSTRGGARAKRVLVTFKRPVRSGRTVTARGKSMGSGAVGRHKVREEIEMEVADGSTLAKIFEGLGMRGWFRYEKFRTTFRFPKSRTWARGLLIELDETPIGTFVELEGPGTAIDRAAKELGFSERDYIVMNYLSLYRAECRRRGEKPGDMVFQKRN
jgi:adenylate cyclase class 2